MPTYHLDVYCKKEGRTIRVSRQTTKNFQNNKEAVKELRAIAKKLQLSQNYTKVYCKIKKDQNNITFFKKNKSRSQIIGTTLFI